MSQKKNSHSNPVNSRTGLKLRDYEDLLNHKDIKDAIDHYSNISVTNTDEIKEGKKAKTVLNKYIRSIKQIHSANNKDIRQFGRDVLEHEKIVFEGYSNELINLHSRISEEITSEQNKLAEKEAMAIREAQTILTNYGHDISNCSNQGELTNVLNKIDQTISDMSNHPVISLHQSAMQMAETGLKQMKMKSVTDFNKKSSQLSKTKKEDPVIQIKPQIDNTLLDQLSEIGFKISQTYGWTVSVGNQGIGLYTDPSSTLTIEQAIEKSINEFNQNNI